MLLAGSVDCLAKDANDQFVLLDWKRSEKNLAIDDPAFKNQKGTGFCNAVPDTAFWCAAPARAARTPLTACPPQALLAASVALRLHALGHAAN